MGLSLNLSFRSAFSPVGCTGVEHLLEVIPDVDDHRLPEVARMCLAAPRGLFGTTIGCCGFPNCDWSEWRQVERSEYAADDKNAFAMTFLTLDRV